MKKPILFYIPLLLISSLLLSNRSLAQDYTQWQLPEGAKMRIGKGAVSDITFSPDGTQFAVATNIGIWIYDAKTGAEITVLKQPDRGYGKIAFSPDGHDHVKRADFLAHDNIDNYLLSLGSWFGNRGFALCYGDLKSTVAPPDPPEPPEVILSPPGSQLLDQ